MTPDRSSASLIAEAVTRRRRAEKGYELMHALLLYVANPGVRHVRTAERAPIGLQAESLTAWTAERRDAWRAWAGGGAPPAATLRRARSRRITPPGSRGPWMPRVLAARGRGAPGRSWH